MENDFEKNSYVVIKNFLHEEILSAHYTYFLELYKNKKLEIDNNQVIGNAYTRDDVVFDTLLSKMAPLISKIVGKELWPTYAFCRLYKYGEKLEKHTDRKACEYSASITLGFNNNGKIWPIFLENDGKKIKFKLDVGEALIYKGRDLPHWRKKFKGDHQAQLFLHYVDSNGPYKNFVFDGRPGLNSLDYDVFSYEDIKFINA